MIYTPGATAVYWFVWREEGGALVYNTNRVSCIHRILCDNRPQAVGRQIYGETNSNVGLFMPF